MKFLQNMPSEECNREPCHPSDPTMPMQNAALAALPMSRDTMGVKACKNMKVRILLAKKSEISTKCRFTSILCSFQPVWVLYIQSIWETFLFSVPLFWCISEIVVQPILYCLFLYILFLQQWFLMNEFELSVNNTVEWKRQFVWKLEIEMLPSPCSSSRSQSFWCDIDHSFYFRSVIKIHVFSHCLMSF